MTGDLKDQLQRTLGGSYTLERELGGGGMSRVFVAEEISLGRKVVVKVLPIELAASVNVERFRREIQLVAKLQHPHIVPVLAAGISDGVPYYTMPFIEGESLRARLARSGELPVQEAAKILRDVLSALSYAHEHGVVHRDIKPDNILLTGHHAVVADFGVAKALSAATDSGSGLTSAGVVLGTPAYMAPEQAAGDPSVDHRADLYAVGTVAYEMVTGNQVFSARSPQAMLAAHAAEKPEPVDHRRPGVAPALASVIMRSLEKRPADRPQSADEMLAEVEAATTTSGATGLAAVRHKDSTGRSHRALLVTGLGFGALLVAVALYFYTARRRSTSGVIETSSASSDNDPIHAVAVIPFANTGGDPQDEYFSDGMTDELAHALSRLPRITVAGRSSAYAFKGKALPAQEIGKALSVNAVIEGSVRRAGRRLRVIAQLTSAKSGQVMWSNSYESTASDLFQVQDEFTKAIVGALTPALGVETAANAASSSRGTLDGEAYDLYLKGRFFFAKRGGPNIRTAIGYFTDAATRDPNFARARAGLSMAYSVLGAYEDVRVDTIAALALKNAQIAVRLDSSLGDAHLALANALSYASRFREADMEFQNALRLQPEDATAHQWYGDHLEMLARAKEALVEEQRAAALDPLSAIIAHEVAYAFFHNRRFDEAIKASQHAISLDSTLVIARLQLALDYIFGGQPDKAVSMWEESHAHAGTPPSGLVLFAYAAAGRWDDVSKIYPVLASQKQSGNGRGDIMVRLAVGDRQGALDIFERKTAHGLGQTPYGCDPMLDPLHNEPRFLAVMRRHGAGICPASSPWPVKPPPSSFAVAGIH